jgi:iron complex outermembrane receptor protein
LPPPTTSPLPARPARGGGLQAERDARIYAGYSTGYKGGGFSIFPSRWRWPTPPSGRNTTAYEAGFKTDWLNRKLRVNGAFFWYDYKNLQVARIIGSVSSATP